MHVKFEPIQKNAEVKFFQQKNAEHIDSAGPSEILT